jgi:hypothetical protein
MKNNWLDAARRAGESRPVLSFPTRIRLAGIRTVQAEPDPSEPLPARYSGALYGDRRASHLRLDQSGQIS